jgi:hypothetical protein
MPLLPPSHTNTLLGVARLNKKSCTAYEYFGVSSEPTQELDILTSPILELVLACDTNTVYDLI